MEFITVKCFFGGSDGNWEGICTTFDIATQGSSLQEVKDSLRDAVEDYLEELTDLSSYERKNLLDRKSPLLIRVQLHFRYLMSRLTKLKKIEEISMQIDPINCKPA